MKAWVMVFCLILVASDVHADILRMKSGENKRGKVLSETENAILFNSESDGAVIEINKSLIAIMDREAVSEGDPKKGAVTIFSTPVSQKKNAKDIGSSLASGAGGIFKEQDQKKMVEKLEVFFQSWIEKHPEWTAWLDKIVQKTAAKNLQLDQLVEAAKKG